MLLSSPDASKGQTQAPSDNPNGSSEPVLRIAIRWMLAATLRWRYVVS